MATLQNFDAEIAKTREVVGEMRSKIAQTGTVLDTKKIRDAGGVAPAAHGMAIPTYGGRFSETRSAVAWDQHIIRLG